MRPPASPAAPARTVGLDWAVKAVGVRETPSSRCTQSFLAPPRAAEHGARRLSLTLVHYFLWGRVDCFDLENTQYSSSAFPFPSPRPPNKQQTCGDTSALKRSASNCFPKESKAHPWRWRAAARTRGEIAVGPQPPGRGGWWLAHPVCVLFPRPLGGDLARRQK